MTSGILVVFAAGMFLGDWPILVGLIALIYLACIWQWQSERSRVIGDYWRKALNRTVIVLAIFFVICFSCKEGDFPVYFPYMILPIPAIIAIVRTASIFLKKKVF